MAFEGLSSRLQDITRRIKGEARITESNMKDMLREVKLALLEADVNYKIVKEFIASVQEKALGQDVMKSLTPGQQVIKIVKDEMIEHNLNELTVSQFVREHIIKRQNTLTASFNMICMRIYPLKCP